MDARLTVRGQTLYAMSAEAGQIVAADGSRKWVVADGIAPTTRSARGLSYAATLEHVAWHDGDAIVLVPIGGGELVRVSEAGVQCLGADDHHVYVARDQGDGTSEIGCIDAQLHTHVIARCPGSIDRLVASGEYLAWALRDDVYALRMRDGIAAGAPSLVYTAPAAFAMSAAEPGEVVIATEQSLARLTLSDGDLTRIAPTREMILASGTPLAVAWHAGVAYIARDPGGGLGRCVERVEHGSATIVHALALDDSARISYLVATERGAFWIETRPAGSEAAAGSEAPAGSDTRLVHVARDAPAVAPSAISRTRTPSMRPATHDGFVDRVRTSARTTSYSDLDAIADEARMRANPELLARTLSVDRPRRAPTSPPRRARTSSGSSIDITDGRMRATFTDASCAELVARIAADAPRRVDLVCNGTGTAFSAACRGVELASVHVLVADEIGDLTDVLAAMPALERVYVVGGFALEPIAHANLRELHLAADRLELNVAGALMSSRAPVLERCALSFSRVSTAGLLGVVKGMQRFAAPALREVHLGALRGPDQIRDVLGVLIERGKPPSWDVLSFGGELADEDAAADVLDAVQPPAGLRIVLRLADMYSESFVAQQLRRKKWLCDLRDTGWRPCDPRVHADW